MTELITLLVAEDDPADVLLLQRALRLAQVHARIEFVPDGVEAVRFLSAGVGRDAAEACPPPSLLLLDLKMPRMDGLELLRWLRTHPVLRPPLVVVFSSSNRQQDIDQVARLGADHYLVKPSDPADLVRIVKRLEQYCLESPAAAGAGWCERS